MKIIKKGRKQKGWSKEFACTGKGYGNGGCGAILLVSKFDLYEVRSYDYTGDYSTHAVFTCPCCLVETIVDVPSSILYNLPSKTHFLEKKHETNS